MQNCQFCGYSFTTVCMYIFVMLLDFWTVGVSANGAQPDQTALQNKSAHGVHYLQFYLHLLDALP